MPEGAEHSHEVASKFLALAKELCDDCLVELTLGLVVEVDARATKSDPFAVAVARAGYEV